MTREEYAARIGHGVVTITDPELIRAAWGDRRISGRSRGMELAAYPDKVTANRAVWLSWFDEKVANPVVRIVIAKKKAQARIDAALGRIQGDPETAQPEPIGAITQDEIDDLLAERADLRANRQFGDSDRIRDYLVKHGVIVADSRIH